MANLIRNLRSDTTLSEPTITELVAGSGQIALNTKDGRLFIEKDGTVIPVGEGTKGAMVYTADYDASVNLAPITLDPTNKGYYYVITGAGTFGGIDWMIGDWAVSTGAAWQQLTESDSRKAVANGFASLDGSGKIPVSQIPDSIIGGMIYQGAWDATTNTPDIATTATTAGQYWIVDTDGTTNLPGAGTDWLIGDWAVYNGTDWDKVDNTQASVIASQVGFTPAGTIASTDVQAAIEEVSGDVTTLSSTVSGKEDDLGTPAQNGQVLSSTTGDVRTWITLPSGVTTFLALTDVDPNAFPAAVAGINQILKVNVAGDAVEFSNEIDAGTY